jgi:2-polyprenyl-3-methyl-5-hydroxy-6-metoxy-1,4-benzoquinol methylase
MTNKTKEEEVKELYRTNPFPPEDIEPFRPASHDWILKSIPKYKNLGINYNIADIGCGTGHMSIALTRFGHVDGYDFSKESIEIAKENANKLNISNINFEVDDITEIKERKKYDLIFSIGVLHHIPNHSQAIENIKKMMNANSLFIVGVYNKWANKNPSWKSTIKKERNFDAFNHPYEKFYGKNEYKKILESHGLKVIGIYNNAPDIFRLITGRGRIVSYCCQISNNSS